MEPNVSVQETVDRLASLPQLQELPPNELEWLAEHGERDLREPGIYLAPGETPEHLMIVLAGRVAVRIDRGVGPRRAAEWVAGDVTGVLPFSRMGKVQNDIVVEVATELLSIHRSHFPEMIQRCPTFTGHTVHTMLDRARRFNSSELQDEKMLSLGKLAAGLAHELNNPASAAMRGARLVREGLSEAERASRALCEVGLSPSQIAAIEQLAAGWWSSSAAPLSFGREGAIEDWLSRHHLDGALVDDLVDSSVDVEGLDELAALVPAEALPAALRWVIAESAVQLTARDVEEASVRIYDLVAAVKRFTYMDTAAGLGPVDVPVGLRDTIGILGPKARAKEVRFALDVEPNLSPARAVGSDLNQVWAILIDNAIDAVGDAGRIDIAARREFDRVVVRVVDDGPGIAPEVLPRIFDPFFTTKPPGKGLGLGLEIARQLLRHCGGEISATSEPGRTEFRVSLEAQPPG